MKPYAIPFPCTLLLSCLLAGFAFAQPRDLAPAVVVAEARQVEIADEVEALGTLRANESVTLTVTVTDTVVAIHFEDGQRVEAGDNLVELSSAVELAEMEVEQASIAAEARRQVDRLEGLVSSGAASESLLDQRRREYQTALARLNIIKARIDDRRITAPFSGVVGLRNISVGSLLQPGVPITTLDDDSIMKLNFSVPSVHLTTLVPGLDIIARAAPFGDRVFTGTLSSVDTRIDPVTRAITARAILENDDRLLKPGLLMNVILLKNQRQAIVIPESAIVFDGRQTFVFLVQTGEDGRPLTRKTEVRIGTRGPGKVEILEGLVAGDLVVTHGTIKVSDAMVIRILARQEGNESLQELLRQDRETGDMETR
ncbi:efflux RND transporter periplasmic adaptor subunit [Desulfobulbus alkaliphilus]|uniref:efflux RND transporter periplasmic adaptor subunit n=1 Tax=Desulfobulbus alkaliphilus TaxID=869814 RepID=UPI001962EC42|nr:efflux RND transporter periplasmic adaptor subunit [Desulfobulbus alkaliphilus]MBM9536514.1 efflux RND transporter periplasmic adaptor subunit [Desulfobulbus alkaliphilus]